MCIFAHMKKSRGNIKHIGITLIALLFCDAVQAQRFVSTSLEGALTVCAITQDKQGMLWVGTDNGLYSYDGYHSYRHYIDQSPTNTRVNALGWKGNTLYLATGNGMLTFDVDTYSYSSTSLSSHDKNGNSELRVIDLDGNGTHGKNRYGSDVYALLHTSKGQLMGTISGLFLVKSEGRRVNMRQIALPAGKQPLVNALAYDAKRHCYWIGTEGALYCADLQLKNFSEIASLDGNSIKCLAEEANGNLYIGTDNGLYRMAMDNTVTHFVHDSRDASTIPNNIVWACYVDRWQNVWIGTDNGLSRFATHTYFQYTSLDKVTFSGEGNCLHAMLQTRQGEWWMGGTNGLIHFVSTAGFARGGATYNDVAWYKQNNETSRLTHNRVRKIYEDREGDVWICTDHGINFYDRQMRQMRNFIVYDKTGKYSTAWAYDILEDSKGRLWMASYMGGVFVIDKQRLLSEIVSRKKKTVTTTTGHIADYHFSDRGKNALSGLHIGQIVMDGKGQIWASTYDCLDCIDPVSMKVSHVGQVRSINYLLADNWGNVWVGCNGKVKCYRADSSRQGTTYATKEWNVGGKVSTMCDVKGKIWVVCGNECSVLSMNGESIQFVIPSITPLTIFDDADSHSVVMGGNDGFVTIDDSIDQSSVSRSTLMLAGIIVNGKQVQNVDGDAISRKMAPRALRQLTLASDENNFTLQLTDLPFANLPSHVYAYRLEGSDHDWQYTADGNIDITYNGLSHGDYHLTVHVVDGEGNIGDEVYALDISILPPWYLSVWAKMVYLLLAIGLAWGIMKFYLTRERLAEERRQKAEILEQVETRMNFFASLAKRLKAAVARRSFDEITDLVNHSLEMGSGFLSVAHQDKIATTENNDSAIESKNMEESQEQENPVSPVLSEADQRLLKKITEAIEQHMIDSDFNVTTLQETIGVGGKQLYRKLKAMTGMTPVEYIRNMRMKKAALMLNEGKFSVSEVMYTVGFSNSSYFSKCFSKAFGMTPTEYMKK